MKKSIAALSLLGIALASSAFASEGKTPEGIRHLDHVFVIMMENTSFNQILNNPNAPFINQLAHTGNLATNYFGIGHPSLTNYLEVVGGSNFGVQSDNDSDWHSTSCATNLTTGVANTDNPPSPSICPISGSGTDAATPAIDSTNETQVSFLNNIDGIQAIPAAEHITGKTIADQLVEAGRTWKSYQENVPASADSVNYSDGVYSNLTDFSKITPVMNPPLTSAGIVSLYAAKHNPFVYFQSVQEGRNPELSLANTVGFDGANGLFGDLASGKVPAFSFIAPNQCNDQHGRGNSGPFCNYDPVSDGTQAGLNPALIQRGDMTIKKLVTAIKNSPAWSEGNNAIVVLWDENDYSLTPNINKVALIVDTNYGANGKTSAIRYNHFSLLKTIEAAFELPCLNHACDANVQVMSDLFGSQHDKK
ncbi:alkaline phosphatase family protein [Sideroxydans sp. CL21]|uniref:alkaline phosphatase family protein n=1 Tax=Sideroxydans sp. CL21 TaxID=2600596 RepID=UPI0024BD29D6|nr:alkaline phosphatase family protein [Sideroxydans sp. CL21]